MQVMMMMEVPPLSPVTISMVRMRRVTFVGQLLTDNDKQIVR